MQPIDVVVLTKNSEHLLDKCLASVYENVPVKNLIIVDGFSTDRTLKDSDVILSRGWFRKAEKNVRSDVGAVWGVNIDVIPNIKDKRIIKLQNLIARQCFSLRGGTHDTLIRRDAVADIEIPEQLHAYEDAYIINWIKKKGYQTVIGDDVYCLHFKAPENWKIQNGVSQAIVEFRCGLVYSHMYEYMFFYPVFMFHWVIQLAVQGVKGFSSFQRGPKMIR
jgi:glycosyltransferase involved in cell wall biosynthesis